MPLLRHEWRHQLSQTEVVYRGGVCSGTLLRSLSGRRHGSHLYFWRDAELCASPLGLQRGPLGITGTRLGFLGVTSLNSALYVHRFNGRCAEPLQVLSPQTKHASSQLCETAARFSAAVCVHSRGFSQTLRWTVALLWCDRSLQQKSHLRNWKRKSTVDTMSSGGSHNKTLEINERPSDQMKQINSTSRNTETFTVCSLICDVWSSLLCLYHLVTYVTFYICLWLHLSFNQICKCNIWRRNADTFVNAKWLKVFRYFV